MRHLLFSYHHTSSIRQIFIPTIAVQNLLVRAKLSRGKLNETFQETSLLSEAYATRSLAHTEK